MLFSVITVTKNNLEGLEKTADSLAGQSCAAYEWIVIDGGSADGSRDFLAQTRAQWISEPDGGIFDAMNKGLDRARGTYIQFLNAGDTLAGPHTLSDIAGKIALSTDKPGFVFGDTYIDIHGFPSLRRARAPEKIAYGMPTCHQSMLYGRQALHGLRYSLDYKVAGDYDFTARFLLRKPLVLYCPFPVSRFEPGGLSERSAALGRREEAKIRRALDLCNPVHGAFITARHNLAAAFRTTAPSAFLALRNLEGIKPEPGHDRPVATLRD